MQLVRHRTLNHWYADEAEHAASAQSYWRRILADHLPSDPNLGVFDAACGFGFAMRAAREMGFLSVVGIDSDSRCVRCCREQGLAVSLAENPTTHLRNQSEAYGAILAFDFLEHLPADPQLEFVVAAAGALKSQGTLICTVPNANSILASRCRYDDLAHRLSFTEHSLDFLLYHGGFRVIRIVEVDLWVRPQRWWLPTREARYWWLRRSFRCWRRLQMMAELGPQEGRDVPLSPSLLAVAKKA